MPRGEDQAGEGVGRLAEAQGGGQGGREVLSTSCTGPPQILQSISMERQAMRLATITCHPQNCIIKIKLYFCFQVGFADETGYESGAASDEGRGRSGTKSGFPNWADRCGEGCQGEPVQEVSH